MHGVNLQILVAPLVGTSVQVMYMYMYAHVVDMHDQIHLKTDFKI